MINNSIELLSPDVNLQTSAPFYVPHGKQLTIVGLGLTGGDKVTFEMILVPAITPDNCKCPPKTVVLPTVGATQELRKNGKPLVLDENNSFVVIDSPQNIGLRAVLNTDDVSGIHVFAISTDTKDVTDILRGYAQ